MALCFLIIAAGLAWLHVTIILKHGPRKYLSDTINLHEAVIAVLCIIVLCLQWTGGVKVKLNKESCC